jgi:putative ABC transport system substrate-binding protein
MRRREFVTFLGGSTVAWSLAARAQQPERVRRIGSLTAFAETDMEVQTWYAAFRKRLEELGWVEGHNIHIDYRWGAGNVERMQVFAKELVRWNPEVILSGTTPATAALQAETPHDTDCVCGRVRSSRQWIRREPRTSRRQHHRLH